MPDIISTVNEHGIELLNEHDGKKEEGEKEWRERWGRMDARGERERERV